MLNRQMIFDDVVKALYEQGEKSVDDPGGNMCRYRKVKDDGTVLKCGIGHIIPDDKYDPDIDSMCLRAGNDAVRGLIDPKYGKVHVENYSTHDDRRFLNTLQIELHDNIDDGGFREYLIEASERFATIYELEPYNFS